MSVVAKAIELLGFFSEETPEIGLSQICRKAKRDKATTYRHLSALEELGFVEQNPVTKAYRIGPAVLHLAEVREATVPRKSGAIGPLNVLAEAVGETAHISVLSGKTLHALADCESSHHSTRAVVDMETLPLHATASGICALAFGDESLMDAARDGIETYTSHTLSSSEALKAAVAETKATGFGVSDRGYGDDTYGIAAPVFDQSGTLAGAVAVASVANRITDERAASIRRHLAVASEAISHNWGGTIPSAIRALWNAALSSEKDSAA